MKQEKSQKFLVALLAVILCAVVALAVSIIAILRPTEQIPKPDIDTVSRSVVTIVNGIDMDKEILTSDVAIGSGFCVKPGTILTNYHNVQGDNTQINIVTYDNNVLRATITAKDEQSDVALLTVEADLPVLSFAENIEGVGQQVFNLSTPISAYLRGTYSQGLITNTDIVGFGTQRLLQTNINLSPGCSGSPLVDTDNRVVGMITFKSTEFGAEGLGFAIPAAQLREIIDLLDRGIEVPDLQLTFERDIYQKYGLPGAKGLVIREIGEDSPVIDKLQIGDILTHINDQPISNTVEYSEALRKAALNQKLKIKMVRDQAEKTIDIGEILS